MDSTEPASPAASSDMENKVSLQQRGVLQHSAPSPEKTPGGRCVLQHSVPSPEKTPGGRYVQQHSVPSPEVKSVPVCGPVSPRHSSMSCIKQTAEEKLHRVDHSRHEGPSSEEKLHRVDHSRHEGPSGQKLHRVDHSRHEGPSSGEKLHRVDHSRHEGPSSGEKLHRVDHSRHEGPSSEEKLHRMDHSRHEGPSSGEKLHRVDHSRHEGPSSGEKLHRVDHSRHEGPSSEEKLHRVDHSRHEGPSSTRGGDTETPRPPADTPFSPGPPGPPWVSFTPDTDGAHVQHGAQARTQAAAEDTRDISGETSQFNNNNAQGFSPDAAAAAALQSGKVRRKRGRPFKRRRGQTGGGANAAPADASFAVDGTTESPPVAAADQKPPERKRRRKKDPVKDPCGLVQSEPDRGALHSGLPAMDVVANATGGDFQASSTDATVVQSGTPRRKPGRPFKRKCVRPLVEVDAPAGLLEALGPIQRETTAAAAEEEAAEECGATSEQIGGAFATDVPVSCGKPRRKRGRPFKRKQKQPSRALADADAVAGHLEARCSETDSVRAAEDDTTDRSAETSAQIAEAFPTDGTTSARCGTARRRPDQRRRPFGRRKKRQTGGGAVQDPLDACLSAAKTDALPPGTDDVHHSMSKRTKRRAEVASDPGSVCFSTVSIDALSESRTEALPAAPEEVTQKAQRRKKRQPETFTDQHNAGLSAASTDTLTDALPMTHVVQKSPRRKQRLPQTAADQRDVCSTATSADPLSESRMNALPMTQAVQKAQRRKVRQDKAVTDEVDACLSAVPNSAEPFPESTADHKPPRRKKTQSEIPARRVADACFRSGVGDGSPQSNPGPPSDTGAAPKVESIPDPLPPPNTVLESTPDPLPAPNTVLESTSDPLPAPNTVLESTPDPLPAPNTVLESTPDPLPAPNTVLESTPDPLPAPNTVLERTPDPLPAPNAAVEGVGATPPEKRRPGRPRKLPLAERPEPDAAVAAEDAVVDQVEDPVVDNGEHSLRTLRTRRGADGCFVPHTPQNKDKPVVAKRRRRRKPPVRQIIPGGGEALAPSGGVGSVEEEGAPVQPRDEEEGAPVQPRDEEEGAPVGDEEQGAPVQPRARKKKKRRRVMRWGVRKRPNPERAGKRAAWTVQRAALRRLHSSARTGQSVARTGQQPDDDDTDSESRSTSATDTAPSLSPCSPCLSTGSLRTAEMLSRVKSEDMETELDYLNPLPPPPGCLRSQADTRVKAERPSSCYNGETVRTAPTARQRKRKARWGRRKTQRSINPLPGALEARLKREPDGIDAPPGSDDHLNGVMASGREGQQYKCPDCGVTCRFLSEYIIHSRVHSGEKPYHCHECGRGFNRNSNLTLHLRTHRHKQRSRTYQRCPVCQINISCSDFSAHLDKHGVETATTTTDYERKRFNERRTFARRKRRRRDPRGDFDAEFTCKYCGKLFPYPSALDRHVRVHTGERPFKCDICGKGFGQAYFLRVHELSHWSVKRYNCTLCRKAFTHISSAKKHVCLTERRGRRLLSALSYTCHVCKETCPTVETFNGHMRSHTGAKLYRCLLCDKLFGALSEFQQHRAHCSGSGRGGVSLSRTADHEEAKISQEYLLPEPMRSSRHTASPSCLAAEDETGGKRRSSSEDEERGAVRRTDGPFLSTASQPPSLLASKLNDLDERSDPRKYFCPSCGRLFRHMGRLRAHMLTHGRAAQSFDCERCGKTLEGWAGLWRHQRLHRQRRGRFACPRCARRFRFAAAYRRHVAETHPEVRWVGAGRPGRAPPRPYQCEECGCGFRTLDELFGHQRCHSPSASAHNDDDSDDYRLSVEHHHHNHHNGTAAANPASKTPNPPHVNGYSSAFCNTEPHRQHHPPLPPPLPHLPPPLPPPSLSGGPHYNPYYYYFSQHPQPLPQPVPSQHYLHPVQYRPVPQPLLQPFPSQHHLQPDQYRPVSQPRGTPPFLERGGGGGGNWTLNHHMASSSSSPLSAGEPSGSRLFVSPVVEPSGSRLFVSPVVEPSGSRLFVSPVVEPSGSRLFVTPVVEPSGSRLFVSPVQVEPSGSRRCVSHTQHEVTADGIKCAVCSRPFTDVARLYQHYLLHARGHL